MIEKLDVKFNIPEMEIKYQVDLILENEKYALDFVQIELKQNKTLYHYNDKVYDNKEELIESMLLDKIKALEKECINLRGSAQLLLDTANKKEKERSRLLDLTRRLNYVN